MPVIFISKLCTMCSLLATVNNQQHSDVYWISRKIQHVPGARRVLYYLHSRFSWINNHHDYCMLLLGDNFMWFILLALVAKGSLLPGKWPTDFNARQPSLQFKERNVLVIITVILTFPCFDSQQYPFCSNGRFKLSSHGTCIQGRSLETSFVLYEPKQ